MKIRTWMIAAALALAWAGLAFGLGLADVKGIRIEEVLSIGTLEDDLLYQWTGVAVDGDGDIYVLDAMDCSLKKFDAGGRLLAKVGRKGQGPGEFVAPRFLDCSSSRVFATDQNKPLVQVFDRDLRFQRTIPCPATVLALKALADDKIAVLTRAWLGPCLLLTLDAEGKTLSELAFADGNTGLMMDASSFAVCPDGSFVIAYLFQDRVERWSAGGKRLWSAKLLGPKKPATKKIESPLGPLSLPTETCFNDIAVDSRGNVFVLAGRLADHPARDVYVLGSDGRLLTTFTLPDTSHCLVIDGKSQLYARANDGITLKKYRILYE